MPFHLMDPVIWSKFLNSFAPDFNLVYSICDNFKLSFNDNRTTLKINEICDCGNFHSHNLNAKQQQQQQKNTV